MLTRAPFPRRALALACALMPLSAWAEDVKLEQQTVTATSLQVPLNASSVSKSEAAGLRAASSDTASLLRNVPGVSLYGAGGVSSLPAIHGLADDRLRIKVDGMDLIASCPNHMNPALSYIDPSNLGALRVYAGVTPVSVGGDSLGGSIVAETPAPRFAATGQGSLVTGETGTFYRSNGNGFGGNLAASYATEAFSISYAGAHAESDNYRAGGDFKATPFTGRAGHTLPLDEVGSTAYETNNHTLGLALKAGKHLFEAKLGYQDLPLQAYPNQRMDMLDNTQERVNLRYLGTQAWGSIEARLYHEKVDHFMDFGPDKRYWYGTLSGTTGPDGSPCAPLGAGTNSCAAGMPMRTASTNIGASLQAQINLPSEEVIRLGGQMQQYRLDDWWPPSGGGMWPDTFWNINNGQRDRLGLFAEWEARLTPQWLLLSGVRYEQVRTDAGEVRGYSMASNAMGGQYAEATAFNNRDRARTDHNWDFTLLARYSPSAALDLELGLAQKVRSPNLYERYTWSSWPMAATMNNFVGDGNGYVGNLDLKPEKAHTIAATFDWHARDGQWKVKATPYFTQMADYIDAARRSSFTPQQYNVLSYVNQSARLYGVDFSAQLALAKASCGELGLQTVVNYTRGENRDTGDDLYNIMPLNARVSLTHKLGLWESTVEVVGVAAKKDLSDVRNEIKTPGYELLNLRTSYTWNRLRLDLGVENALNKRYDLPLGGAYLGQGRTMSMNTPMWPWGTAVPGMGRSFYLGVNYRY
ncbi:Heme/hemopexin utilization protein C [Burkholderiales bacterium]|nr:MAG: TonB-dependent receptor [Burkholderiales bacterium]CAG1006407.1 Heme/hemopexin utilization protein C [Burkholderiales bacterium]